MQARLSFPRFPSTIVAVVFVLVASLILGGVLGYTIKQPLTVSVPPQILVVQGGGAPSPVDDQCIWTGNGHKGC